MDLIEYCIERRGPRLPGRHDGVCPFWPKLFAFPVVPFGWI